MANMRRHVSININFLLTQDDETLGEMFSGNGAEVRAELEERKANGEVKIGSEGCEGFCPVNGCPGHPIIVNVTKA